MISQSWNHLHRWSSSSRVWRLSTSVTSTRADKIISIFPFSWTVAFLGTNIFDITLQVATIAESKILRLFFSPSPTSSSTTNTQTPSSEITHPILLLDLWWLEKPISFDWCSHSSVSILLFTPTRFFSRESSSLIRRFSSARARVVTKSKNSRKPRLWYHLLGFLSLNLLGFEIDLRTRRNKHKLKTQRLFTRCSPHFSNVEKPLYITGAGHSQQSTRVTQTWALIGLQWWSPLSLSRLHDLLQSQISFSLL